MALSLKKGENDVQKPVSFRTRLEEEELNVRRKASYYRKAVRLPASRSLQLGNRARIDVLIIVTNKVEIVLTGLHKFVGASADRLALASKLIGASSIDDASSTRRISHEKLHLRIWTSQ